MMVVKWITPSGLVCYEPPYTKAENDMGSDFSCGTPVAIVRGKPTPNGTPVAMVKGKPTPKTEPLWVSRDPTPTKRVRRKKK